RGAARGGGRRGHRRERRRGGQGAGGRDEDAWLLGRPSDEEDAGQGQPEAGERAASGAAGEGVVSAARPALGLLLITMIWGGTFPVVKELVDNVPPYSLLAARFGVAGVALGAAAWLRRREWRPGLARAGGLLGLFLWGGYFTQT